MSTVRLILALHNHQPVGNFDGVFEAAYRESYLPFLEVLENYPEIPFVLHTSGPLLEWLVERHPEYIARVRALVEAGRVEILGRRVLRADHDDDPPPRPGGADPRLLGLSPGALPDQGPRHVGPRAGLGAAPRLGDRRGGHRVHDPRRLPLPARGRDRRRPLRLLPDRGRGPAAQDLPRLGDAALHDPVPGAARDLRVPPPAGRAAAGRDRRLRRRRREVRLLARHV